MKSLDFSVDGTVVQSADAAGELLLWNVSNQTQARTQRMASEAS